MLPVVSYAITPQRRTPLHERRARDLERIYSASREHASLHLNSGQVEPKEGLPELILTSIAQSFPIKEYGDAAVMRRINLGVTDAIHLHRVGHPATAQRTHSVA